MSAQAKPRSAAWAIPAFAYGAAIRARNAWYDRPGAARRAAIPVISIGNLTAGGTGKTPLVHWLAERIREWDVVPAVVSRGYGGTAGPGPLVVSTGEGPRVNARTSGDEPHQLARALQGVIVIVGADRVEGARAAAEAGAGAIILDDGFQHRRLARDLDVVLLDARAPFDGGHLLPWGWLREPAAALRRAHVVVLTRVRDGDFAKEAFEAVRATGFSGTVVRAGHRISGFHDAAGVAAKTPARAFAFCGIGDPELFRRDLEGTGAVVAGFRGFRDHHPYSVATWEGLVVEAKALGVPLVTTDKDFSRLAAATGAALSTAPLLVARMATVVWDQAPFLTAVRRAIDAHREAAR